MRIETEIAQFAISEFVKKLKEYCDTYSASTLYASDLLEHAEVLLINNILSGNQPPPIEKEMTAAELVEKLKEHYEKSKRYWLSCHSKSGVEFKGINGGALIEYAESLLKQNSEGKES